MVLEAWKGKVERRLFELMRGHVVWALHRQPLVRSEFRAQLLCLFPLFVLLSNFDTDTTESYEIQPNRCGI